MSEDFKAPDSMADTAERYSQLLIDLKEKNHCSLATLRNEKWPEGSPDDTPLVRRCKESMNKPIRHLTIMDIERLLSQRIAVEQVMPLALSHLERDPLVEARHFPGDLLEAAFRIESVFWDAWPDFARRLAGIAALPQVEAYFHSPDGTEKDGRNPVPAVAPPLTLVRARQDDAPFDP